MISVDVRKIKSVILWRRLSRLEQNPYRWFKTSKIILLSFNTMSIHILCYFRDGEHQSGSRQRNRNQLHHTWFLACEILAHAAELTQSFILAELDNVSIIIIDTQARTHTRTHANVRCCRCSVVEAVIRLLVTDKWREIDVAADFTQLLLANRNYWGVSRPIIARRPPRSRRIEGVYFAKKDSRRSTAVSCLVRSSNIEHWRQHSSQLIGWETRQDAVLSACLNRKTQDNNGSGEFCPSSVYRAGYVIAWCFVP